MSERRPVDRTARRAHGLAVAVALMVLAAAPVGVANAEPSTRAPAAPAPAASTPATPPVDSPPVDSPPAESPPAETPPAETPPAETPPAETPPATTPSDKVRPPASSTPALAPGASPEGKDAEAEPVALSFSVGSSGGPVAGAFFQDLGLYVFQGTTTGLADGATITISRQSGSAFPSYTHAVVRDGVFRTTVRVTDAGTYTFMARTVVAGDPNRIVDSARVRVAVADSGIRLDRPVASIDALVNPAITGSVFPARARVKVNIDVLRSGNYRAVASTVTDAAGKFRINLGYGNAILATYTVRSAYLAVNSPRWEKSGEFSFTRKAVLNAKVTETTAAEVEKTYRRGCPVGRSKLRTVTMNFYGRDEKMHRGVIIIRTDLTPEIIRGFGLALAHRYPVAKMDNPNKYGGNDPRQMEANNTSGFNCRKVVGNPYAQSPHSYGIALDVNTVQNPYRDSTGKWWPSNGKDYIDRTPKRWGMLTTGSYLTTSLRKDNFFWGGLWNPGRDYQHFQYTK